MSKVILCVDDAPENLDVLTGIVKEKYKAKVAKTGTKAIEILEKGGGDLMFLDLQMPEMDGWQVMSACKEKSIDTPIVIVSGENGETFKEKALKEGASEYILKPVDAGLVLHLCEKY